MKLNCSTQELSNGMNTVKAALSQRTTLPILQNFLLEADKDGIRMTSTDLTMGVITGVDAKVGKDGAITVPAKKFTDILGTLPSDGNVKMSLGNGDKLTVMCGRSRFVLAGMPKEEYPALPKFNSKGAFTILADDLADILRRTLFATSTDETRYILNGVHWVADGKSLRLEATDGRRMALISRKELAEGKEFKAIVPTKFSSEALAMVSSLEKDAKVKIFIDDNLMSLKSGKTSMTTRLVEGSFPDIDKVIPKKSSIKITIDRKPFITILRQASLALDVRGGAVKFEISKGKIKVSAKSQTMEFEDEIPVDYSGENLEISFNPLYLLDGFKVFTTDSVRMELSTPVNPALFVPVGKDAGDYKYVVMPVRK